LQPEGWDNIMEKFAFYAKSDFCYPVKVREKNKIIGIGSTIVHGDTAWLGHIIVHPEKRNLGIGKMITERLLEISVAKKCKTVNLIATELGEPVYRKFGFETETEYLFFKDIPLDGADSISENIIPFSSEYLNDLIALDQKISDESRGEHISGHLAEGYIFLENNEVQGYYLPTFGDGMIGAASEKAGTGLLKFRLAGKERACFPVDNSAATSFFYSKNCREYRRAKRMRLGEKKKWIPENIYNRIGGNLG
jgi:GNAT superfamily N-acetyltransferase